MSEMETESLRFEEEIQGLILSPPPPPPPPPPVVSGSSFTALLGLPPPQAVELLHHPYEFPQNFSPTFPSNAALVDRAARLSVFAAEAKAEPADSCGGGDERRVAGKRKELEKSKVKGSVKKSKSAEEVTDGDEKQLPYVHVRARRGQATDSHSLAERARREKINARMKLLQELVPGCNKISGTALVLDEIINHVQSLQRQVEFLSMRLATVNPTVNPRVEFGGIENILSSECGRLTLGSGLWLDGMMNGPKEPQQQSYHQLQQNWLVDHHHQQQWESDHTQNGHIFVSNPNTTTTSIFNYDTSTPDSVPHPNQLKTEM